MTLSDTKRRAGRSTSKPFVSSSVSHVPHNGFWVQLLHRKLTQDYRAGLQREGSGWVGCESLREEPEPPPFKQFHSGRTRFARVGHAVPAAFAQVPTRKTGPAVCKSRVQIPTGTCARISEGLARRVCALQRGHCSKRKSEAFLSVRMLVAPASTCPISAWAASAVAADDFPLDVPFGLPPLRSVTAGRDFCWLSQFRRDFLSVSNVGPAQNV